MDSPVIFWKAVAFTVLLRSENARRRFTQPYTLVCGCAFLSYGLRAGRGLLLTSCIRAEKHRCAATVLP